MRKPKFEVYKNKAGEFAWRLKARNGKIIAQGEGYKSKQAALNVNDMIADAYQDDWRNSTHIVDLTNR